MIRGAEKESMSLTSVQLKFFLFLSLLLSACVTNTDHLVPPEKMTGKDHSRLERLRQLNEQAFSLYTLNDSEQALALSLFLIRDYRTDMVRLIQQELLKTYEQAVRILTEQHNFDRAFDLYKDLKQSFFKSSSFDRYYYRALINTGILFLKTGNPEKSEAILSEVIKKTSVFLQTNPTGPLLLKAYYNQGIARMALGKNAGAVRDFNVLIRSGRYSLSPEVTRMRNMSLVNKAAVYIKEKKYSSSLPLLQEAVRLSRKQFSPEDRIIQVIAYYNLGIAYLWLSRRDKAEEYFSLILENYENFNDPQVRKYYDLALAHYNGRRKKPINAR